MSPSQIGLNGQEPSATLSPVWDSVSAHTEKGKHWHIFSC